MGCMDVSGCRVQLEGGDTGRTPAGRGQANAGLVDILVVGFPGGLCPLCSCSSMPWILLADFKNTT
jgi:hypothetical protein